MALQANVPFRAPAERHRRCRGVAAPGRQLRCRSRCAPGWLAGCLEVFQASISSRLYLYQLLIRRRSDHDAVTSSRRCSSRVNSCDLDTPSTRFRARLLAASAAGQQGRRERSARRPIRSRAWTERRLRGGNSTTHIGRFSCAWCCAWNSEPAPLEGQALWERQALARHRAPSPPTGPSTPSTRVRAQAATPRRERCCATAPAPWAGCWVAGRRSRRPTWRQLPRCRPMSWRRCGASTRARRAPTTRMASTSGS